MGQNTVGSDLTLYKLRNGKVAAVTLDVTGMLVQLVTLDATGQTTVAPDWSTPKDGTENTNQPTITPRVSDGYTLSDEQWYYNGDAINFGSDGISVTPNTKFKKVGTGIKIVDNLASADNLYTDTIKMTGMLYDIAGAASGTVEKSIDVPIMRASASGYTVLIDAQRTTLTAKTGETQSELTARLFHGVTEITDLSGYTVEWHKGLDATVLSSAKKYTVDRSMVNGYQMFIARVKSGGTELDAEGITIYDEADDYDVSYTCATYISASKTETSNNVREVFHVPADGKSCTVTPVIKVNDVETTPSSYSLSKIHADTLKYIAEVSGSTETTTDEESSDTYNTTSGPITVTDKDYISIAGGTRHEIGVKIIAAINL